VTPGLCRVVQLPPPLASLFLGRGAPYRALSFLVLSVESLDFGVPRHGGGFPPVRSPSPVFDWIPFYRSPFFHVFEGFFLCQRLSVDVSSHFLTDRIGRLRSRCNVGWAIPEP